MRGFGRQCTECGRAIVREEPERAVAAAIPDTRSEAEIRVAIKQALRALGFHVWDTEQQRAGVSARVDPGMADLLVIGSGVIAFAEIKGAKGKMKPAQEEFAATVRANGGTALVWRSEADAIEFARGIMESEERAG